MVCLGFLYWSHSTNLILVFISFYHNDKQNILYKVNADTVLHSCMQCLMMASGYPKNNLQRWVWIS